MVRPARKLETLTGRDSDSGRESIVPAHTRLRTHTDLRTIKNTASRLAINRNDFRPLQGLRRRPGGDAIEPGTPRQACGWHASVSPCRQGADVRECCRPSRGKRSGLHLRWSRMSRRSRGTQRAGGRAFVCQYERVGRGMCWSCQPVRRFFELFDDLFDPALLVLL